MSLCAIFSYSLLKKKQFFQFKFCSQYKETNNSVMFLLSLYACFDTDFIV